MAYIYKLPSGRWRAQIALKGVRASQSFATKGAAQAWASREEAAILDGKASLWPAKTVAQALERYEREVTPGKRSQKFEGITFAATLRDYPELCSKVMHQVTTADLAEWRDSRLQKVSGSTVVRQITLLRNVWTVAAKEWKWTPYPSPWRDLRIPPHNPPRERINNWREIRVMLRRLNYVTGKPPASLMEQVAYAWLIALRTAMRASEVRSITPQSVDLQARVVVLTNHKTKAITGRARRVPINRQAARLIALCPQFTVSAGSLDSLFRKARDRAGLDGFTFHDSRATALTLLSRRVDILTLQRISGHRNINQLTVYYRESDASIAARL